MTWQTVIGLEVHTELNTKTKIFCACQTAFGGEPNTRVCPVCAGFPGVLPKLNRAVVEYALRIGLALNCSINKNCAFDRKNYFYPDLPKAYQISQLYAPICRGGELEIKTGAGNRKIGLVQIHMEEDAGKLIHDGVSGETFMDFNRCGVPLLEIVSRPDMQSASEAVSYMEKLREILLFSGISDCKMQEGSMRADVNISLRKEGEPLGARVEMKNLNSFKSVARAIEYERERQTDILEAGGAVLQETRRFDDDTGVSYPMRSKENAQDYRYFPEPDLQALYIDDLVLQRIKASLPELAHEKRLRFIRDFGLTDFDVTVLTAHKNICDLFEQTAAKSSEPKEAAHLITGEIMRLCADACLSPSDIAISADKLSEIINLLKTGKINRNAFKQTVEAVFKDDVSPEAYIAQNALFMSGDADAILAAVNSAKNKNKGAVNDYKQGKAKAFGFLMGAVMRELGGAENPELVKKTLIDELEKTNAP